MKLNVPDKTFLMIFSVKQLMVGKSGASFLRSCRNYGSDMPILYLQSHFNKP